MLCGPIKPMSRRWAVAAALGVVVILSATTGGSAGAAGGGYRPEARFAEAEYSAPFYGRLWSNHAHERVISPEAAATDGARYFAQVAMAERDPGALDLSFAVEAQSDPSAYQNCHPDDGCTDVTVQATPEGLLYLHTARSRIGINTHLGGFTPRVVELSATDADSGLKVYREVTVGPSPAVADCGDYGVDTPEAFTCLFLRQLLPAGQAAAADEASLRAKLPPLVQDSANYRLVFAEEFNGTPPPAPDANDCRDGLSTLDPAVWNYFNACNDVDSRGRPCGNVGNGGFTMGVAGTCGLGPVNGFILQTSGHLHLKYGYLEARYTFNTDHWNRVYDNYNMILHAGGLHLRDLHDQYGVEIESWEDYLKHSPVEIDIFEHVDTVESSGAFANWDFYNQRLTPFTTTKAARYCRNRLALPSYVEPGVCKDTDTFTVTRGIEWTPRGYRTFIKVDGVHSDFTMVPKEKIYVARGVDGGDAVRVKGKPRDQFFEYLVPGDTGSLLEQVSIGHVPVPLNLNTWSYMTEADHPYIRRLMTFDYVRVWQPENHYADMEPVYR